MIARLIDQHRCFIPALFVAAQNDDFVPPHHSEAIVARYGGDKNLILVEGDHNSNRPRFMSDSVAIFLMTTLQVRVRGITPCVPNKVSDQTTHRLSLHKSKHWKVDLIRTDSRHGFPHWVLIF